MLKIKSVKGIITHKMSLLTKPYVSPKYLKRNMIKSLVLASVLLLPIQPAVSASYLHEKLVRYECLNLEYKQSDSGFFGISAKDGNTNSYARCEVDSRGILKFVFENITNKEDVTYREYRTYQVLANWRTFGGATFDIFSDGTKKYKHCKFSQGSFNFSCSNRVAEKKAKF